MCIAVFSCGQVTGFGTFVSNTCAFAKVSTTGAKSVPALANQ